MVEIVRLCVVSSQPLLFQDARFVIDSLAAQLEVLSSVLAGIQIVSRPRAFNPEIADENEYQEVFLALLQQAARYL